MGGPECGVGTFGVWILASIFVVGCVAGPRLRAPAMIAASAGIAVAILLAAMLSGSPGRAAVAWSVGGLVALQAGFVVGLGIATRRRMRQRDRLDHRATKRD